MKFRALVAAVLVVSAVAGVTSAQRISESIQVTVIEVPVTVVDRAGQVVRGLTKEDFEVTDDGKRVPIDYFEVIDLPAIKAAEPKAQLPPPAHRNFLLLFDLANSSPGTVGRAAEAAKEFVEQHMEPRDLAAIGVYTTQAGPRMVTSFTTDRNILRAAISTLGHPKYFKIADPLMISLAAIGVDSADGGEGGPLGGTKAPDAIAQAIAEELEQQNRLSEKTQASEARMRLKRQVQ